MTDLGLKSDLGLVIGYGQAWAHHNGKYLHSTDGGATWHDATDECTVVWRRARMGYLSAKIADTPWWAFRKRRELREELSRVGDREEWLVWSATCPECCRRMEEE